MAILYNNKDIPLSFSALMYMAAGRGTEHDDAVAEALQTLMTEKKTLVTVAQEALGIIDILVELTGELVVSKEVTERIAGLYAAIEKALSEEEAH